MVNNININRFSNSPSHVIKYMLKELKLGTFIIKRTIAEEKGWL
jgi:hypothetical protein